MSKYQRLFLAVLLLLFATACSTQQNSSAGMGDPELEAQARAALLQLFDTASRAEDLHDRAKAVLVFPNIFRAGLGVGAQGGRGVLFGPDGKVLGYFRSTGVSWGLQAGAQTLSEALFLMTDAAARQPFDSSGWSIGVGPTVVVVDAGAARSMNTTTLQADVYAFIFGQQGLMAGLGVQGQRITRLNP
ncbi:lipid-binding SYLF domain-containing protein [Paraburkholderia sp. HC6.4b]|uniref:lipid-binding SYLF domain-containing protein n=1 Tax=unclassified Paraburkholderia TaxID=2615204 RepID=UPI00160A7182|nr:MULTISPECIES: lipid-binding SYLF domain-containing protein [unclassified Paraburkholderia]MBB5409184.1 lipid-binding SYLF domain-containing protein [Paraburkholderia sp. HC6.4b]MBB5450912.1 lipid-binding SYLF domain-containing protein [Paraburkholderia sp. Kb1A]